MAGDKKFILPGWARSLSARVLLLTIFFVMVAEIFIYIPSLANFRSSWLDEKIAAAHLAVLTLEAIPDGQFGEPVRETLLRHVGAHAVVLKRQDRRLLIAIAPPPPIDHVIDLDAAGGWTGVAAAIGTMVQVEDRVVRLIDFDRDAQDLDVEVIFDEAQLRSAMLIYSRNILLLALAISAIAAAMLYASLQWLMVRPMRRMTADVAAFAHDPEDARAGVRPTERSDEIGVAQQVLAEMQNQVRASLTQKQHLAALGSAVSKINHDLRGILSTAVLMSDRLTRVEEPEVKRLTPPLIKSIDRAINLCAQTLNFARDEGPQLSRSRFRLVELVNDVAEDLSILHGDDARFDNQLTRDLVVEADRDQLYRVLANLARNAYDAGASDVTVTAEQADSVTRIQINDNGPGLSQAAVESLFKPFAASTRAGGTGLGLSIARDVMRAHGGEIDLVATNGIGTTFELRLPD